MARTKVVDDTTLIRLIDQYLLAECKGDPSKLKLPGITNFVKKSGYPTYAVESLRRNKAAREYIDKLQAETPDKALVSVVSYKSLDVNSFLQKHRTPAALKAALMALDASYKDIVDSAVEIYKRMEESSQRTEILKEEIKSLKKKNSELMDTIAELKGERRELRNENNGLRSVVDDYVYPDIANELLAEAGVLKGVHGRVDPAKVSSELITGNTVVQAAVKQKEEPKTKSGSIVIKGMFDPFDEDED